MPESCGIGNDMNMKGSFTDIKIHFENFTCVPNKDGTLQIGNGKEPKIELLIQFCCKEKILFWDRKKIRLGDCVHYYI